MPSSSIPDRVLHVPLWWRARSARGLGTPAKQCGATSTVPRESRGRAVTPSCPGDVTRPTRAFPRCIPAWRHCQRQSTADGVEGEAPAAPVRAASLDALVCGGRVGKVRMLCARCLALDGLRVRGSAQRCPGWSSRALEVHTGLGPFYSPRASLVAAVDRASRVTTDRQRDHRSPEGASAAYTLCAAASNHGDQFQLGGWGTTTPKPGTPPLVRFVSVSAPTARTDHQSALRSRLCTTGEWVGRLQ